MTNTQPHPFYFNELFDSGILANLSPAYALVYLAYVRYTNGGEDSAFPSQEKLSKNLGIDVRTVRRAIKKLDDLGYIKQVSSGKGKGSKKSNLFTVTMPSQLGFPKKSATQAPVPPATAPVSQLPQTTAPIPVQPTHKLTYTQLNNIKGFYWKFEQYNRQMLTRFPTEQSLIDYVESKVSSNKEFDSLCRQLRLDPTQLAA